MGTYDDFLHPGYTNNEMATLEKWTAIHGALMALSWVVLLPLGVIYARHRDALCKGKMVSLFGGEKKALWFYIHVSLQLSGMASFITAWIIAFAQLPWEDDVSVPSAGALGKAHKGLGIATFGLAVLQVIVAVAMRPHPDAPMRRYWNLFHWNVGRVTMLTAWAALFTGIGTNHHPKGQQSGLVTHAIILAAIIGCLLVWDAVLTWRLHKKATSVSPSSSLNGNELKEKMDSDVEAAAAPA